MRVTNDHATAIRDLSCAFFQVTSPENGPKIGFWTVGKIVGIAYNSDGGTTEISSCDLAADLLEARSVIEKQTTLIKEMREDLLKISQYPIAFVCEEARIIAREAWKKSKEYAE